MIFSPARSLKKPTRRIHALRYQGGQHESVPLFQTFPHLQTHVPTYLCAICGLFPSLAPCGGTLPLLSGFPYHQEQYPAGSRQSGLLCGRPAVRLPEAIRQCGPERAPFKSVLQRRHGPGFFPVGFHHPLCRTARSGIRQGAEPFCGYAGGLSVQQRVCGLRLRDPHFGEFLPEHLQHESQCLFGISAPFRIRQLPLSSPGRGGGDGHSPASSHCALRDRQQQQTLRQSLYFHG